MDIDINGLKKDFVRNFILDERKQEAQAMFDSAEERKSFVNKILDYKTTLLNKSFLQKLTSDVSEEEIIDLLEIGETDLCYVISSNEAIDDKIMQIDYGLKKIHEKGGGIAVTLERNRIYFKDHSSKSQKFIGKIE